MRIEETDDDVKVTIQLSPHVLTDVDEMPELSYRRCIANGGAQRACREERTDSIQHALTAAMTVLTL